MNKLEEINLEVMKVLRHRYREDWPKNQVGFYMLDNYLKWFEKCSIEGFKAYCVNGDYSDGTFVFTHYNFIYGDTLSEDTSRLTAALCLMNLDTKNQLRYFYPDHNRDVVWDFIKAKGFKVQKEWKFLMYYLAPEDAVKIELPKLQQGMNSRPVDLRDVQEIKENWPFRYPLCETRLEYMVKYNPSIGVYTDSGTLAGWVLRYEFGAAAMLHVHEPYRKQGLAKYLTKTFAKKVGKQGEYSYATIVEENKISRQLFESVGYKWDEYIYLLEIY